MWISIISSKLSPKELQAKTTIFDEKARIIEDIMNRELAARKVKIPGVQKITITLIQDSQNEGIFGPMKGVSPVVNINKIYDFKRFNAAPKAEQGEMVLTLIVAQLKDAAREFGWKADWIDALAANVRALDFKHRYQEWKPKPSRDKKYNAAIEVEMTAQAAQIDMVFYSPDDTVVRKVNLINVRPDRFFVKPLMGSAKWVSATEFELVDKQKEIHFKASPLADKATVYFTPADRDVSKVIDDLVIAAAATSDAKALALLKRKLDGAVGK